MSTSKLVQKTVFESFAEYAEKSKQNVVIVTENFITLEKLKITLDIKKPSVIFALTKEDILNSVKSETTALPVFLVDFEILTKYKLSVCDMTVGRGESTVIVFSETNIEMHEYESFIKCQNSFGFIENFVENKVSLNVMINNGLEKHFKNEFYNINSKAIELYTRILQKHKSFDLNSLISHLQVFLNNFKKEKDVEILVAEKVFYSDKVKILYETPLFKSKKYRSENSINLLHLLESTIDQQESLEYKDLQSFYFSNNPFRETIFILKGIDDSMLLSKKIFDLVLSLNAGFVSEIYISSLKENSFINELEMFFYNCKGNEFQLRKSKMRSLDVFLDYFEFKQFDKNNLKHLFLVRELDLGESGGDLTLAMKFMYNSSLNKDEQDQVENNLLLNKYRSILSSIDIISERGVQYYFDNSSHIDKQIVDIVKDNFYLFDFKT